MKEHAGKRLPEERMKLRFINEPGFLKLQVTQQLWELPELLLKGRKGKLNSATWKAVIGKKTMCICLFSAPVFPPVEFKI